ncbi:MAG: OmpA family protein [Xenococcaceae cyanobacterium MO_207.B15]|nr:OmpA family protein [Xenococcaceae cyanobacterium MO_207.B15]
MSESIDNLIDLLLDLEASNNINKPNNKKQSSPKKQQTPSVETLANPTVEKAPVPLNSTETKTLEQIESNQELLVAKVIEIIQDDPIESLSSAISNLTEEKHRNDQDFSANSDKKAPVPSTNSETKTLEQIESNPELLVAKVTEIIQDDPIESLSSAISNLTEEKHRNDQDFSSHSEKIVLEDWIAKKEEQLNELAESVNNLIPLMIELLSVKVSDSQELILQTMIPVIDRAIEERSGQDLQKMAHAIAKVLPDAITQEIKIQPQSLGKALAPEMALSIEEQIRLDEDAISCALGSEMGKAIKAQIELEKDAMVDALYPVIGSTISKYLAEEIQRINDKVEKTLSPEGISRKIRAKMRGVSEAELILQESLVCSVRAIFLIHKDSGLVIRDIQPDQEHPLESDMVAGMLTAIRSFANDCITSDSELNEIDYSHFQILLEAAGYCYIAVVVNGIPPQQFRDRIRETLSTIVMKYGNYMEEYEGDPSTIPQSVNLLLKNLTIIETDSSSDSQSPKKSFASLFWLLGILLAGILIPWGIVKYRTAKAERITQEVAIQLDSNPELSVYDLEPKVHKGNIIVTGKVPSDYHRNVAEEIVGNIATSENLNLDNQIIAVNVPPDPTVTAQEVKRATNLLNLLKGVAIAANYQNYIVTITGFVLDTTSTQTVTTAFSNIPGVKQVVFTLEKELPTLDTRIYFDSGESKFKKTADSSKIESIKQFLDQYPSLNLKVIGHSDRQGSTSVNQKLALERANSVYKQAISQGVNPDRLEVIGSLQLPPDITYEQPLHLSRCVRFESFIP